MNANPTTEVFIERDAAPQTWAEKRAKRERELEAARAAPRLDPILWAPPFAPVKPEPDPMYKAYRNANRAYRRAFGRGERWRKNLLACATAKLKENA